MADVKISALPAATTPLDGTEVLPIVQSSTTKQVAVSNLTAGRAMSATSLTLTTPLGVASGGTGLTSLTAGYIPYGNGTGAFGTNGAFWDSANGRLGVGTSSPSYLIHAYGNGNNAARIHAQNVGTVTDSRALVSFSTNASTYGAGVFLTSTADSAYVASALNLFTFDNQPIAFGTGNTLKMTLDLSGNLGLGVTPSAWNTITAFQVKNAGYGGYSNNAYMTANAYYASGGTWTRLGADYANAYMMQSGQHQWYIAGSSTAGSAISFTPAMTLDASGYLGVGTTNPSVPFVVSNGGAQGIEFTPNDTNRAFINAYNRSGATYYPLHFTANTYSFRDTAGGYSMYINDSGNLMVGTTGQLNSALVTLSKGTTTNTSYSLMAMRGGSQPRISSRKTTSVSTTATTIADTDTWCNLTLVFGTDGTNMFSDLVLWSIGTGTVKEISNGFAAAGTPAARTYSQNSSSLKVAMASGTYSVSVVELSLVNV